MVGSRHPAAAAGTPMCGRDPSARSAGDKRQRREGRLQVGFGQIYAPFLARYTPRFWLKYTPKRRFWKTRRLLRGVFLRASITRRIFLWICAVCLLGQAQLPVPIVVDGVVVPRASQCPQLITVPVEADRKGASGNRARTGVSEQVGYAKPKRIQNIQFKASSPYYM